MIRLRLFFLTEVMQECVTALDSSCARRNALYFVDCAECCAALEGVIEDALRCVGRCWMVAAQGLRLLNYTGQWLCRDCIGRWIKLCCEGLRLLDFEGHWLDCTGLDWAARDCAGWQLHGTAVPGLCEDWLQRTMLG